MPAPTAPQPRAAQLDAFARPVPAAPTAHDAPSCRRVSEMAAQTRPAVRLAAAGAAALSLEELLTLALGCRTAAPARALADAYAGSLRTLAADTPAGVARAGRLPRARVARLHAALELGRRLTLEHRDEGAPIQTPRDVFDLYRVRLQDLPVEQFHVCVLDAQHRVERDVLVTRGILNSSLVHPREVFREAIAERAAAVILVHNTSTPRCYRGGRRRDLRVAGAPAFRMPADRAVGRWHGRGMEAGGARRAPAPLTAGGQP